MFLPARGGDLLRVHYSHVVAKMPHAEVLSRLFVEKVIDLVTIAAVGDLSGTIRLFVSDELNVDHRTFDSGDGRKEIDVPVVSLDEYFTAGHRVDLIKIDVQGYELSVLQGAKRVLAENHDIKVLMEFWPYGLAKAAVAPSTVIELINSLGFEIRTTSDPDGDLFDGTGLDPNNIDHYCNLIVTKRSGA